MTSPTSETDAAAEVVRLTEERDKWRQRAADRDAEAERYARRAWNAEAALAAARAQPTAGVGEALEAAFAHDDAGPQPDGWDTDTGEFEDGAQPLISDWAHNAFDKKSRELWAEVRRLLAASPGATTAQTEGASEADWREMADAALAPFSRALFLGAERGAYGRVRDAIVDALRAQAAALSPAQTAPRDDVAAVCKAIDDYVESLGHGLHEHILLRSQIAWEIRAAVYAALRAVPAPEGEVRS